MRLPYYAIIRRDLHQQPYDHELQLVSAENHVTLCDLGILAAKSAESVSAENPDVCAQSRWTRTPGGRALLQCPVGPVGVVVIGVLAQNEPEVPFAGDQHPVRALAADTGDPAFRDRVRARRLDRRLDDPDTGCGKHGVESRGELGAPVPDQELEAISPVLKVYQEVPDLLGHPLPRRVGGDPGQCTRRVPCSMKNSTYKRRSSQGGQYRSIGPGQPRVLNLTLEHRDLVTQDQDLHVPGAVGAGEQGEPAEDPENCEVGES
jgi:hypothetical protein